MAVKAEDTVPDLLRSIGRCQAYDALRHLLDKGESSVGQITDGVGGTLDSVKVLMLSLHREGLVARRTDGGHAASGRRPYLYQLVRPVAAWLRLTEQFARQLKGGGR